MAVRKDGSENRFVELELEVPGSPEQVWHAIATGEGMSAWFTPTEVDGRVGGRVVFHLGPGMDSVGEVTAWDPPRRFAYEERDWLPGAPPVATECTITSRDGGTCIMRMVHSLFTSREDWDDQLESFEAGWPGFFVVLRLYLRDFAGQPAASARLMSECDGAEDDVWRALATALGVAGIASGQPISGSRGGLPAFEGVLEPAPARDAHEATVRLERPGPGVAMIGVFTWEGKTRVTVMLYFYGRDAAAVLARERPAWQAWIEAWSKQQALHA